MFGLYILAVIAWAMISLYFTVSASSRLPEAQYDKLAPAIIIFYVCVALVVCVAPPCLFLLRSRTAYLIAILISIAFVGVAFWMYFGFDKSEGQDQIEKYLLFNLISAGIAGLILLAFGVYFMTIGPEGVDLMIDEMIAERCVVAKDADGNYLTSDESIDERRRELEARGEYEMANKLCTAKQFTLKLRQRKQARSSSSSEPRSRWPILNTQRRSTE